MELAAPSVADAVDAAVAAGAEVVTIAPYFLSRSAARHAHKPDCCSTCCRKHPRPACTVTATTACVPQQRTLLYHTECIPLLPQGASHPG